MSCFEGTIIFCSRIKIHRKISLENVTLKNGCLNCNVWNTLSSTRTFKVLRANQSIILLVRKETLKILSRYVWTPLMNILTCKLGSKILILVSEHNVRKMESLFHSLPFGQAEATTPDKTCWDKSWKCLFFPIILEKTETADECLISPYPKLFRIAWQLYMLVFRARQLWKGGGEGAYFFCLEETGVGRKS